MEGTLILGGTTGYQESLGFRLSGIRRTRPATDGVVGVESGEFGSTRHDVSGVRRKTSPSVERMTGVLETYYGNKLWEKNRRKRLIEKSGVEFVPKKSLQNLIEGFDLIQRRRVSREMTKKYPK